MATGGRSKVRDNLETHRHPRLLCFCGWQEGNMRGTLKQEQDHLGKMDKYISGREENMNEDPRNGKHQTISV